VHSETIIVARDLIKASAFYRIAAVLILVLDLGHTAGFPWSDLKWGVDLGSMRSTQFEILGCSRIYWDFYVGFGLFVAAFLLPRGRLSLAASRPSGGDFGAAAGRWWAFSLCFAAITVLSWRCFFTVSIVFSIVITV
jgi:hypothetical protein